jgi:Rad3-related DNA helicase
VCLLSLITSYQYANPSAGKLVYCTRTVPEMNSVVEELGVVLAYRAKELNEDGINNTMFNSTSGSNNNGAVPMDIEDTVVSSDANIAAPPTTSSSSSSSNSKKSNNAKKRKKRTYKRKQPSNPNLGPIPNNGLGAGGSGALALCLSSRRNMCIHERVLHESDREAVDAACRSMTASWVLEKAAAQPGSIETCSYYNSFKDAGEATSLPSGIYGLEELKIWGKDKGWCPYYLTRQAINHATILVFNYQYMVSLLAYVFLGCN